MGDPISGLDAAYSARFEAGPAHNTSLIAEDGLGPISTNSLMPTATTIPSAGTAAKP